MVSGGSFGCNGSYSRRLGAKANPNRRPSKTEFPIREHRITPNGDDSRNYAKMPKVGNRIPESTTSSQANPSCQNQYSGSDSSLSQEKWHPANLQNYNNDEAVIAFHGENEGKN